MTDQVRQASQRTRRLLERPFVGGSRAILRRVEGRPFERTEDAVAIFVVPWPRSVTGGYVSILELMSESHRIGLALGFDTHACDVPSERSGARIRSIANLWTLESMSRVLATYRDAATVWIHVPSHAVDAWTPWLVGRRAALSASSRVVLNVLNQNIKLCPSPDSLRRLCDAGYEVTMTTAHVAYASTEWAEHFGVPVHHISTWLSRERYDFARRAPKVDRVLFSNDNPWANDQLIAKLPPEVTHRVIKGISYDAYLRVMFRSKWSVAFGEGLDAYFIETAMSGGVPFAVHNKSFFTENFGGLPNVFPDPFVMIRRVPKLIERMRNEPEFLADVNRRTMKRLDAQYNLGDHRDRLARYYLDDYDFVPSSLA